MSSQEHKKTIPRFLLVGAISAALYLGISLVTVTWLHWNTFLGISIAFVMSTIFHYMANRHFSFQASSGRHRKQIPRYAVVWAVNYGISLLTVWLVSNVLGLPSFVTVVISAVLTSLSGYFLGRLWIFRVES